MEDEEFDGIFDEDEERLDVQVNDDADMAEIIDMYWQVPSPLTNELTANSSQTELDLVVAVGTKNICTICCSPCKCECENNDPKVNEWMLDSGASFHFTGDMNDFVEYAPFKEQQTVITANSSASIEGQGTIIILLSTEGVLRLFPVYYVPTLMLKRLSGTESMIRSSDRWFDTRSDDATRMCQRPAVDACMSHLM